MSAPEDADRAPVPCTACRGTGKVISRLGGEESTVPCPWCDGTATVLPGHDAQAHWAAGSSATAT